MSGGLEHKPRGLSLVQRATADAAEPAPGKRTLIEHLAPGVPGRRGRVGVRLGKAAKDGERAATQALRGAAGARRITAQESLDAARVGTEAAEVEPVAGRLPRNHEYAGKEFPRELLPPKYREKGLRFKSTGYPDFEPYAMTLPNGKKTVWIELTGSREADRLAANRAAGFQRTPEGYAWHHLEDEGTMMLVPLDLHRAVAHTGGAAKYVDRTGVVAYE
jgi:hypothetical protein